MTNSLSQNEIAQPGAAQLIADLAQKAINPGVVNIPLDETLGPGLPKTVPVYIDGEKKIAGVSNIIESYRQYPRERTGTAEVETLDSFINLTKRHLNKNSVIFGETRMPDVKLTSIIDYHESDETGEGERTHAARKCAHRIVYKFPLTEDFKAWINQDEKKFEQLEFAQFLEEHAAELAAPSDAEIMEFESLFREKFATPAELIVLSRELEVHTQSKLKRAERLSSGERIAHFETEHRAANGEPVTIPGIFIVSVRAWADGNAIRIPARLRYRLNGSALTWSYDLYRAEFWLRSQVIEDLVTAGKETGLPIYLGRPEIIKP
jgi:uncharacterized protein YfdQ (DUF2303 family)